MRFIQRLRYWLQHRQRAAELHEEMAIHRELVEHEYRAQGMAQHAARDAARRRMGNETYMREESSGVWIWPALSALGVDMRYAVRSFRRSPGFTAIAAATLAFGIAANLAMFGVVDALLFRAPEGIRDPQDMVRISIEAPEVGDQGARELSDVVSYPDFETLRTNAGAFGDIAAFLRTPLVVGEGDAARHEEVLLVSGNYFSLLGASPLLGRALGATDDQEGAALPVAILSWEFWQRAFGGDPRTIGKTIRVSGQPFAVVGIAARHFVGTDLGRPALWLPLQSAWNLGYDPQLMRAEHATWLSLTARLRAPLTRAQASARASTALQLARAPTGVPAEVGKGGANAAPLVRLSPMSGAGRTSVVQDNASDRTPPVSLWFLGITGVVMLIACANVANLLLARASTRQHELAVRASLGATRGRLTRQLLTESVVLSSAGVLAGVLLAAVAVTLLPRLVTLPPLPPLLSQRLLGFTVLLLVATTVLAGIAPAVRASRDTLRLHLGLATRAGGSRSLVRQVLVVVQLAASVVLLVSAALFLRSMQRVRAIDAGIRVGQLLEVSGDTRVATLSRVASDAFWRSALERVQRIGGVRTAALGGFLPFEDAYAMPVAVPGEGTPIPVQPEFADANYFRTLGLSLRAGREFTDVDQAAGAAPVVILNESLSRRLFGGANPIGRCVRAGPVGPDGACAQVIGVVADAKYGELTRDPVPLFYRPMGARPVNGGYGAVLHVRTDGDPANLVGAVRREILRLDPTLLYVRVQALQDLVAPQIAPWRTGTWIFSVFGGVGLLLAAIGLYGVINLLVQERTHELGVRMALGAARGDVMRMVFGQGVRLTALGLAIGALGAAAASQLFAAMIYGIHRSDPVAYLTAAVVLTSVALIALWVPARRATRLDPVIALRGS